MNLLYYIIGGNPAYHTQCHFSIYSFLVHKENIDNIYIYTDHPGFYKQISDRVNVVAIDQKKINEWRGEYDFFWRTKIKLLEEFSITSNGCPFMYLDTDTFLYNSSNTLVSKLLENKTAFMHTKEAILSQSKGHTERKMWKQIAGKEYAGIRMDENACMWNAGVVALPAEKQLETIRLALSLCDEMCEKNVTRRLIEQFSLSTALSHNYSLQGCEDIIGHYWGNKGEWDSFLMGYFLKVCFQKQTTDEIVAELSTFNFNQFPIFRRVSSHKKRLIKKLNELIKDKKITYLKHSF